MKPKILKDLDASKLSSSTVEVTCSEDDLAQGCLRITNFIKGGTLFKVMITSDCILSTISVNEYSCNLYTLGGAPLKELPCSKGDTLIFLYNKVSCLLVGSEVNQLYSLASFDLNDTSYTQFLQNLLAISNMGKGFFQNLYISFNNLTSK